MTAGRRDFEGALGAFLALDVGEIESRPLHFEDFRLRARQHLAALEMIGKLDERCRRDDLDFGAGPGGFRPARRRTHQALATRIGADGGGEHAGDRRQRAVEAELAQNREARQRVVRNGADRRHQPERDRQIVMAAFLGQIGGREIDGDAACRQRKAGRDERGTDPFAGFRNRFVGQADNGESRQPGRHLHLNVDRTDFDALECNRGDALDHVSPEPGQPQPMSARTTWPLSSPIQSSGTFHGVKNI